MLRLLVAFVMLGFSVHAQGIGSSYSTRDGRAGTVVVACPSQDGSYTALVCAFNKPSTATYLGPAIGAVATANVAVTVFPAGSVTTGCDIVNTGPGVLYLDFVNTALAGSTTSIPLQTNQSFHCPFPPLGGVSAVASQPQSFVAIRY